MYDLRKAEACISLSCLPKSQFLRQSVRIITGGKEIFKKNRSQ